MTSKFDFTFELEAIADRSSFIFSVFYMLLSLAACQEKVITMWILVLLLELNSPVSSNYDVHYFSNILILSNMIGCILASL